MVRSRDAGFPPAAAGRAGLPPVPSQGAGHQGIPVQRPAPADERILEVLLVEDDEGDFVIVEELLKDVPDRVRLRWARSLSEARELLDGVDCVLLDLGLPDTVGLDGLRRLHEHAVRVPIVVLTGLNDEAQGVAAMGSGAQDYLVKGTVTGRLLIRTIRYAIQRSHVDDVESALLEERLRAAENARLERGLLPRPIVADPRLVVVPRYQPGGGRMLLGGDFYDVVEDAAGAVHMIIGDVAGHGPDQAALGVALRIAWRALVLAGRPAAEILATMDRVLSHERHEDLLFATVCTASITPARDEVSIFAAGHPPPLLATPDGWRQITLSGGPALGLLDDASWRPTRVALPPGWRMLLFTDGLIEGLDSEASGDRERLGVDGLLRLLPAGAADAEALDALVAAVTERNGGPLTDDLALLLIAANPPAPSGGSA
ncbi:PP2C family protein-serine/threonine phosphatase [Hamadaea tsunoensis]|uniref:PP2C family protein-serine/threonine phosphatase n=1 Tax=Hamadaea tsunoensis TaxID=53368 RepID=UPI00041CAE8B|nr:fused response regulator/phosphatase [Hamadaea tsunoensis]